jgi:CYTH domain-containing protein
VATKAARRELPSLAADIVVQLNRIERRGELNEAAKEELNYLFELTDALSLVRIGIGQALDSLQHEVGIFAEYFWEWDERQDYLEAIISLVDEFLESPRYGLQ